MSLDHINRPTKYNRICFVLKLWLTYNSQPLEHYQKSMSVIRDKEESRFYNK